MKAKDIQNAGIPAGPLLKLALSLMGPAAQAGLKKKQIMERLRNLVAASDAFWDDPLFGPLAKAMIEEAESSAESYNERDAVVPYAVGVDSGSGNHFVEFVLLNVPEDHSNMPAGEHVAILSHSVSRGAGATIADYYWKLAMAEHKELPKQRKHLAWLMMDKDAGREYWQALQLMGQYAEANHEIIHRRMLKVLKAQADLVEVIARLDPKIVKMEQSSRGRPS